MNDKFGISGENKMSLQTFFKAAGEEWCFGIIHEPVNNQIDHCRTDNVANTSLPPVSNGVHNKKRAGMRSTKRKILDLPADIYQSRLIITT